MTVDRLEDRAPSPGLGSIGATAKDGILDHPPLTPQQKRLAGLRCAEKAHSWDDLWLLVDCLDLWNETRANRTVRVRPDRNSDLPVVGVRPVHPGLPDTQPAETPRKLPRPVADWLTAHAERHAPDIIALCDQPGMTAQAIVAELHCDWRIVSRVAVPHLTEQGWTGRRIAAQLDITDRNVKVQRANHRKRQTQMSVDSTTESA